MPIYEYQCQVCDHALEALQKMSDDNLLDCPACNEPKLKKLISASAFKLKGSGWYETDFKNSSPKKPSDNNSKPAKPEAKSSGCASSGCGC